MEAQCPKTYLDLIQKLLSCPSSQESQTLDAHKDLIDGGLVKVMEQQAAKLVEQGTISKTSTENWARIQHYLAVLYIYYLLGVGAENFKRAITHCEQALIVYNCEAFGEKWAKVQHNLGFAYLNYTIGNRANNLEQAITYFENALQIYTPEKFAINWAVTQTNLAIAYTERILGERAQNLEKAIAYCQSALRILAKEDFPKQRVAAVQHNLGRAYLYRICGEREQNLEQAIIHFKSALSIYTDSNFAQRRAETLNCLAAAYIYSNSKKLNNNQEQAINCCREAFQIISSQSFPKQWAEIQNNLGYAYLYRVNGERVENIKQAIGCFKKALLVCADETFREQRAAIQNNLGNAYTEKGKIIQKNLANATKLDISDKWVKYFEQAIDCYKDALQVRTHDAFPQKYAETLLNLGLAYKAVRKLDDAYTTFASAIEIVELLRGEIVSGNEVKQRFAEEWNKLYQDMVEVCLEIEDDTKAIEYVERSKTRNLVELLATPDVYTKGDIPPEVKNELQHLWKEISKLQCHLQTNSLIDVVFVERQQQQIQQLRQRRNELLDNLLSVGPSFNFNQIQATLDNHTAIIEWYITANDFKTFIITRNNPKPIVLTANADTLKALQDWAKEYLDTYYNQKKQWRDKLATRLKELACILNIDSILEDYLPEKTYTQLILVPHRYLHLFPLHTLPITYLDTSSSQQLGTPEKEDAWSNKCLLDRFKRGILYAPSCQLLQLIKSQKRPSFDYLFAIQNPTEELFFTDIEVQMIQQYFKTKDVLEKDKAKKEAIQNQRLCAVHCAHFSCHGYYNPDFPLRSALLLVDSLISPAPVDADSTRYLHLPDGEIIDLDKCLTLADIFTLKLNQCRLVTLSACETGLTDFTSLSDECIGLSSGFLVAGSPCVVGSLWAVNDFATAILMTKFYQNLEIYYDVVTALKEAQTWLRDVTKPDLVKWMSQINLEEDLIQAIKDFQLPLYSDNEPFCKLQYWAAFRVIGQ
ncbi:TPR repeat-containing protein [Kalymmatonema gypsitolerans NIES-4073]|nr:TPR repeat-containing protein [Scytonema sp. NIES-4073]